MKSDFFDIIRKYENFDESHRLFATKAKNVEFINSTFIIDKYIDKNTKEILDCSSGPGIYSLYLAKKFNCTITAVDIVEKYVNEIENKKFNSNLKGTLSSFVANAIDLSMFSDEQFDMVLCMGAYYHLIDDFDRDSCLSECMRVLKKGGYLLVMYLPINFILKYFSLNLDNTLDFNAIYDLKKKNYIKNTDYYCQFTDIRYDMPKQIEKKISELSMEIMEQVGIDGDSILHNNKIEKMNHKEFLNYCELIREIYSSDDTIGMSNHAMIVSKKR